MSQEVMSELVNMSQEIIKLKDQKRELLDVLEKVLSSDPNDFEVRSKARAVIAKAEVLK